MSKSENNATAATYHTTHDWADAEPLSTTLMTAIADAMDEDPREIGPLYEQFDPDALDGLFSSRPDERPPRGSHIGFTFEGYHVFVQSDGLIAIHPPDEGT